MLMFSTTYNIIGVLIGLISTFGGAICLKKTEGDLDTTDSLLLITIGSILGAFWPAAMMFAATLGIGWLLKTFVNKVVK